MLLKKINKIKYDVKKDYDNDLVSALITSILTVMNKINRGNYEETINSAKLKNSKLFNYLEENNFEHLLISFIIHYNIVEFKYIDSFMLWLYSCFKTNKNITCKMFLSNMLENGLINKKISYKYNQYLKNEITEDEKNLLILMYNNYLTINGEKV